MQKEELYQDLDFEILWAKYYLNRDAEQVRNSLKRLAEAGHELSIRFYCELFPFEASEKIDEYLKTKPSGNTYNLLLAYAIKCKGQGDFDNYKELLKLSEIGCREFYFKTLSPYARQDYLEIREMLAEDNIKNWATMERDIKKVKPLLYQKIHEKKDPRAQFYVMRHLILKNRLYTTREDEDFLIVKIAEEIAKQSYCSNILKSKPVKK